MDRLQIMYLSSEGNPVEHGTPYDFYVDGHVETSMTRSLDDEVRIIMNLFPSTNVFLVRQIFTTDIGFDVVPINYKRESI